MSKTNPATQDPTKSEEEIPGSSSRASEPKQNALPNITVEHILDAPKMWTYRLSLLPSYFVALEKYFVSRRGHQCNVSSNFISDSNVTLFVYSTIHPYPRQTYSNRNYKQKRKIDYNYCTNIIT